MDAQTEQVDVLICGGGPVGLLTGYCLARYGLSTCVVEQHDRAKQTMYGRAAMIAPRTMELLEQLDLLEDLLQIGFVVRGQTHFDKNGERVNDVIRYATSNFKDTFHDYLLLVRQKYTEQAIHQGYQRLAGKSVQYGLKLIDYKLNEGGPDEYPVLSTLEYTDGTRSQLRSKYIVGADGGRSTVRELAGIAFEGEKANCHFIRMDGIVRTNMPEARTGNVGIDSASHGSILWACLDHGITRVGFAYPKKLWEEKGAQLTQEDVILEAKEALRPFELDFVTVDWWTAYSVGQRLASTYRVGGRVFIAGDAAHTHSSAAAQGMNTGIHDAVNLSWKLAGHVKGWFTEQVLDSYTTERKSIASRIIEQDSIAALLTAGEIPKQFKDDPDFDGSKELTSLYNRNQALNSGIGVSYDPDGCTVIKASTKNPKLSPGERAPDVLVHKPGMRLQVRLLELFRNVGKFTILTLCGDPHKTGPQLTSWRDYIDGTKSYKRYQADLFQEMSLMVTNNDFGSVTEKLGMEAFGRAYVDADGSAHDRYGFSDSAAAAVVILRPDGTVGLVSQPPDGDAVSEYFAGFLKVQKHASPNSAGEASNHYQTGAGAADVRTARDFDREGEIQLESS